MIGDWHKRTLFAISEDCKIVEGSSKAWIDILGLDTAEQHKDILNTFTSGHTVMRLSKLLLGKSDPSDQPRCDSDLSPNGTYSSNLATASLSRTMIFQPTVSSTLYKGINPGPGSLFLAFDLSLTTFPLVES